MRHKQKAAEFTELVKVKEIDKQKHITTTAPYKTAKGCKSVWYPCAAQQQRAVCVVSMCSTQAKTKETGRHSNGNQK
ncbi:hypothetical protein MKC90_15785 [[Clostridium] innocuum]|nr:hypothetical protein [[Clostridium] innocuum]